MQYVFTRMLACMSFSDENCMLAQRVLICTAPTYIRLLSRISALIHTFVHPSIHLSIHPSIHPSLPPPSIHLPIYKFTRAQMQHLISEESMGRFMAMNQTVNAKARHHFVLNQPAVFEDSCQVAGGVWLWKKKEGSTPRISRAHRLTKRNALVNR